MIDASAETHGGAPDAVAQRDTLAAAHAQRAINSELVAAPVRPDVWNSNLSVVNDYAVNPAHVVESSTVQKVRFILRPVTVHQHDEYLYVTRTSCCIVPINSTLRSCQIA